jgi:REP element-mobilizing transposase RayT
MKPITTIHTDGCGGKSDLFDLNGPEIRKWIKKGLSEKLREDKEDITAEEKATHSVLSRWLQQLHQHLLHKEEWLRDDIEAWSSVVNDIHTYWEAETKQKPFPKLHMLKHSLEFAERHRILGRASETQIESFHSSFNSLLNNNHFNLSHHTPERLRRCLADCVLRVVQPAIV